MPPPSWAPTLAEVAAFMPQKVTRQVDGEPAPTFTDATLPTATQAQELIDQVAYDVAGYVGTVPTALEDAAGYVVILGVKVAVELGHPQEPGFRGGPGATLDQRRYEQALERLKGAVDAAADEAAGSSGGIALPLYSFPEATLPRTSLLEKW